MAYQLNSKLCDLTPYDPIEGNYSIRLDANESFININDSMHKSITDAISKLKLNRYPDPYAQNACKAFAQFYNIDDKYVTAGNGSDELISIITSCFLEKDDKVVTLTPDFSMYSFYSSLYELTPLVFEKNKNTLETDCGKLIEFCKENKAKMLIFSNPCNPTSVGLKRKDILNIIRNLDCLIVIDEAYMDFWSESIIPDINILDNVIILKTCSKALGLAGVRFGFAIAGLTITKALKAAKSPYNTDCVSQEIVSTVLREKQLIKNSITKIINSTKNLYNEICNIKDTSEIFETVYPTNTNFVFIKTNQAKKIYEFLLTKSIAVRCFNGFLRISSGNPDENNALINALNDYIKR